MQQNTTHPLVTIIIPNYNKANFIHETLQSIISQTYKNWEALVIDDGSTDNSIKIIKELAEKEPRIKFFQRTRSPKGGSTCRNIGIENAKGKYIMFLDSDDVMDSYCLEERTRFLEQNSHLDFAVYPVGTFYKTIGDNSMVWRPPGGNHLKKFLSHDLPWNIMSPFWKAEYIKNKLGGFDEAFPRLQDVEFHTKALLTANVKYKVKREVKPQCYYRIDINRTSQNHYQSLQIMQQGVKCYIKKFEPLLSDFKLKKHLRGTLFSFLSQVNLFKIQGWIKKDEYDYIIKRALQFAKDSRVFKNRAKNILITYNWFYQKGFWKVKGFNYLFKRGFTTF